MQLWGYQISPGCQHGAGRLRKITVSAGLSVHRHGLLTFETVADAGGSSRRVNNGGMHVTSGHNCTEVFRLGNGRKFTRLGGLPPQLRASTNRHSGSLMA